MTLSYKKIIGIVVLLLIIVGSFLFGLSLGYENRTAVQKITSIFNKGNGEPVKTDFAPFWKVWGMINDKYVSNDDVLDQKKVYGAIKGLVGSLNDPYTVFFPPEESKMFESDIKGEFQGVGMEVGIRDNILTVIAPLKDTPAFRAGIKSGDQIMKIDDKISSDLSIEEAVRAIRGKKGTKVVFTILRKNEKKTLEISVVRDTIAMPTIDSEVRTNKGDKISSSESPLGNPGDQSEIYVIRLYNFSAQSARLFRKSLRDFVRSKKSKLILDLRGNPGGYLEAAVDMASWFLPAGKVVVREEFAGGKEGRVYRSKGYNIFNKNLKMVILVNGGSASASEILSGALSEHGIATLVGTKTYGKGSVQELLPVTKDTSVKITVARWLTPNGVSISKNGLNPDVEVPFTKKDFIAGVDPQLKKAIDILTK